MKRKKVLSTVVAGALVAAQMAMPVMAADGGEVEVDVTTKTAVIRVQVPTTLEVAVNQFEKGDTGSQIYSGAFDITNKSEIPVKVSVTSTATLNASTPINLVSSKGAAESSTAESGEAWVAVAAKTSATKYTEESGKDVGDLTEANENVTTFVQGTEDATKSTATAAQLFYLSANDTPTVTYTKVAPTDADTLATAKKISYAQIYELTEQTLTGGSEQGEVNALIAAGDVMLEKGGSLTLIKKGTTGITWTSGDKYYTIAADPTLAKDLAQNKVYMYGETGDGGKAGFRYIGKLSEGKETWTKDDLSKIVIKYDITGITGSRYDEVKDDCAYGLYAEASKLSAKAVSVSAPTLTVKEGYTVKSVSVTRADGSSQAFSAGGNYTLATNSGKQTITFANGTLTYAANAGATVTITFNDDSTEDIKFE